MAGAQGCGAATAVVPGAEAPAGGKEVSPPEVNGAAVQAEVQPAAAPTPEAAAAAEPVAAAEATADAEAKKALGNAAYQAKRYTEAVQHYSDAIAAAGPTGSGVYYSNRAVAQAALGDWAACRADAEAALRGTGGLTKKALFQKARAELRLKLADEAEATLRLAEEHGLRQEVERLLGDEGNAPAAKRAKAKATAPATAPAASAAAAAAPAAAAAAAPAPAAEAAAAAAAAAAPAASPASPPAEESSVDGAAKAKEIGTAKYKEGNYREALAEYRRALGLLPEGDTERRVQLLGNVAAAHLMLRQADECRAVCEEALELDVGNTKLRQRLATAFIAKADFAAARAALAAAVPPAPAGASMVDKAEEQLAAAEAALTKGEPVRALGMFAELESNTMFCYPPLALKVGRCHLELKNYPRVLNATQQVLRANPRNIDALLLRSEALYRNNDAGVDSAQFCEALEQGQRLLKEALSFDPDHSAAKAMWKRLKLLCSKQKEMRASFDSREFQKTREIIDAMAEQGQDNPVMLASLYCERAKCGVRLKEWTNVLKDVGQATYRNHSLVQPYLFRAQALQALERFEDAVKELEGLFSWHRTESIYEKVQDAKFMVRKHKRTNYYELLGVPSIASQPEIKKAYRERASEWHPDKKGHLGEQERKNAEEMFKKIVEAYEVMTDPMKKEFYDKGHDLEGIQEQVELKQRKGRGKGCSSGGHCGPCG